MAKSEPREGARGHGQVSRKTAQCARGGNRDHRRRRSGGGAAHYRGTPAARGDEVMIASVSIELSEGRKTVLIMDGPASVFYRGASYDDIRAHGREIIAQADRAESLEATHETLA